MQQNMTRQIQGGQEYTNISLGAALQLGAGQSEPDLDAIAGRISSILESMRNLNADACALADRLFGAEPEKLAGNSSAESPPPSAKINRINDLVRELNAEQASYSRTLKRLQRLG